MSLSGTRSWRAFGPSAQGVSGWTPPEGPSPRTAFRLNQGTPLHGSAHLARLREGAAQLKWQVGWFPFAWEACLDWLASTGPQACRMQLRPDALLARAEVLPILETPYLLHPMPHPLGDPRNAGPAEKGLSGPWDLRVLETVRQTGAADALLCWPDGTVAETAIAACGLLRNAELRMPPLEGRVRSIAEALDLPAWAETKGWRLVRGPIHRRDLERGTVWCMNAVRGLWQAETIQI